MMYRKLKTASNLSMSSGCLSSQVQGLKLPKTVTLALVVFLDRPDVDFSNVAATITHNLLTARWKA